VTAKKWPAAGLWGPSLFWYQCTGATVKRARNRCDCDTKNKNNNSSLITTYVLRLNTLRFGNPTLVLLLSTNYELGISPLITSFLIMGAHYLIWMFHFRASKEHPFLRKYGTWLYLSLDTLHM